MPKVGIMAEVSAEVLETVVNPAKAEKRFNRLVSQLLEAYYINSTVRSIVDGEEALSNLEGLSNLKSQLQAASESVAYMGMINESIQYGLDSAKSDIESENYTSSGSGSVSKSELDEFKKEMQDFKKDLMLDIKDMLQSIIPHTSTVSAPQEFNEPKEIPQPKEEVVTLTPSATFVPPVSPVNSIVQDYDSDDLFDIEQDTSSESIESMSGDAILGKLLGSSNSFSIGG